MAKKGLKHELTLHRQSQAWQMRLDGFTQSAIASALGIKQQSVCTLLKNARNHYVSEFLDDIEQIQQEQIFSIMQVAKDALDSWKRSKESGRNAGTTDIHFGDTRYMKVYLSCLAEIRKIIGVDEVVKYNMDINFDNLSVDELKRIAEAKNLNSLRSIVGFNR